MESDRCKIIDIEWDPDLGFRTSDSYNVEEGDAIDLVAYCERVPFDRDKMLINGKHVDDVDGLLHSVNKGHLYRCMKDKYVFIEKF